MFSDIASLIINTIGHLYLLIIILRFLLQLARADFYNPVSQFVVKATNPLLMPLRKVIPGLGGIDVASIVLAVLFSLLIMTLKGLVLAGEVISPLVLLAPAAIMVLGTVVKVYFWALLIMIIASWIAPGSGNPVLILINQIVEPMMRPLRNVLPPMGGLDLSPILAFLLLQIVSIVIDHMAQSVGMAYSLL